MEFGNYNNYEVWPYQVLGVSCALVMFAVVLSGMAYSKLFNIFMKTPEHEEKELEWVDVSAVEMSDHQAAEGSYTNMDAMEEPVMVSPPESDDYQNARPDDIEDSYTNMDAMEEPVMVPPESDDYQNAKPDDSEDSGPVLT
jgi:hypothetical protein